jgi:arabinogalactan endo-1,4-beta-galactosidase
MNKKTLRLTNRATGETKEYQIENNEVHTDSYFEKVWVKDLITVLNAIGGSKVKVFCYILKYKNLDNMFIGSIYDISKKLQISTTTVKQTLKIMKDLDYLRMSKNGVYQLSPNLIIKGKSKKRQIVLSQYNSIKIAV